MNVLTKTIEQNPILEGIIESFDLFIEVVYEESECMLRLTNVVNGLLGHFIDKTIDDVIYGYHASFHNRTKDDYVRAYQDGTIENIIDEIWTFYGETDLLTYATYEVLDNKLDIESYLEPLFVLDCINGLNALSIFYIQDNRNSETVVNSPLSEVW